MRFFFFSKKITLGTTSAKNLPRHGDFPHIYFISSCFFYFHQEILLYIFTSGFSWIKLSYAQQISNKKEKWLILNKIFNLKKQTNTYTHSHT